MVYVCNVPLIVIDIPKSPNTHSSSLFKNIFLDIYEEILNNTIKKVRERRLTMV